MSLAAASAVSPDGRHVYTVNGGPGFGGSLAIFARDPTGGELAPMGCTGLDIGCSEESLLHGATNVLVSPDGRHVYVAASQRLLTFARQSSGAVRLVGCLDREGNCGSGWQSGTSELAIAPDGRHLYVAGRGPRPSVFLRDPVSGQLAPTACGPDSAACVERDFATTGMAIAPDGRNVYTSTQDVAFRPPKGYEPPAIVSLARDAARGGLTPFACLGGPVAGPGCSSQPNLEHPYALASSPDGRAVYAAFGFIASPGGGVAVLKRDPLQGRLSDGGCVSADGSGGRCVRGPGLIGANEVIVSPDGRSVYVAGQKTRIAVLGPAVDLPHRTVSFRRAGTARARLSCPRVARVRCRGVLVLARSSAKPSKKHPARRLTARRFAIQPERTATITLKLTRAGRRMLRPGRRLAATAAIRSKGRVSGRLVRQITVRRR